METYDEWRDRQEALQVPIDLECPRCGDPVEAAVEMTEEDHAVRFLAVCGCPWSDGDEAALEAAALAVYRPRVATWRRGEAAAREEEMEAAAAAVRGKDSWVARAYYRAQADAARDAGRGW